MPFPTHLLQQLPKAQTHVLLALPIWPEKEVQDALVELAKGQIRVEMLYGGDPLEIKEPRQLYELAKHGIRLQNIGNVDSAISRPFAVIDQQWTVVGGFKWHEEDEARVYQGELVTANNFALEFHRLERQSILAKKTWFNGPIGQAISVGDSLNPNLWIIKEVKEEVGGFSGEFEYDPEKDLIREIDIEFPVLKLTIRPIGVSPHQDIKLSAASPEKKLLQKAHRACNKPFAVLTDFIIPENWLNAGGRVYEWLDRSGRFPWEPDPEKIAHEERMKDPSYKKDYEEYWRKEHAKNEKKRWVETLKNSCRYRVEGNSIKDQNGQVVLSWDWM